MSSNNIRLISPFCRSGLWTQFTWVLCSGSHRLQSRWTFLEFEVLSRLTCLLAEFRSCSCRTEVPTFLLAVSQVWSQQLEVPAVPTSGPLMGTLTTWNSLLQSQQETLLCPFFQRRPWSFFKGAIWFYQARPGISLFINSKSTNWDLLHICKIPSPLPYDES